MKIFSGKSISGIRKLRKWIAEIISMKKLKRMQRSQQIEIVILFEKEALSFNYVFIFRIAISSLILIHSRKQKKNGFSA